MIVTTSVARAPYDGTGAFPAACAPVQTAGQRTLQLAVTGLIVALPFAGLIASMWLLWGRGVGPAEVGLAVFFYLVTGFGVTVGFHRCLTHRSFTARRALRVALAIAGSASFQGDVIGWVATHRRYDRATNLWPLAVLSLGESWHNMHHSDPACARHGVDRGQVDLSAGLIRVLERFGWVSCVRWPTAARLDQHRRQVAGGARAALAPDRAPRPVQEQAASLLAR